MKPYILNIKISGAKNIKDECELSFYKKNITKNFDPVDYNVKSIYGMNGSGKTALVYAMNIFKNVLLDNVLFDKTFCKHTLEIINKVTKRLTIDVDYIVYNQDEKNVDGRYRYFIEVRNINNELYLSEELLERNNLRNTKPITIYQSKEGIVKKSVLSSEVVSKMVNIADKTSIIYIALKNYRSNNNNTEVKNDILLNLYAGIMLPLSIYVVMDSVDLEGLNIFEKVSYNSNSLKIEDIFVSLSKMHYGSYAKFIRPGYIRNSGIDFVPKDNIRDYLEELKGLENFIKLFKEDLINIDTEIKEDKDTLVIQKYFNYGDYRIDSVFESTGIKKLTKIYNAFLKISSGNIVFFDELDANINDVYLIKLIEYVLEYTTGQLIFTTHNLGPMEQLKNRKKSIDFISSDLGVVEWKKNGNYSVTNLYREGMIENHPFNIQAYDFIEIFSAKENY